MGLTRGTLKSLASKAGNRVHATVSRNRWLAGVYVNWLGHVCRAAPDGAWKRLLHDSVQSVTWPEIQLKGVKTRFAGGGLEATLIPHLNDFDFQIQLYRRLPYEAEIFQWLAGREYSTVIEIGANTGTFSLYFATRFPQASVYAFEPSRKAFSRLLANMAANVCPNLLVFNCAIFSESGFLNFHEPEGHLTNGSLNQEFAAWFSREVTTTPVPVVAASAMESFFARPPVLVKIDAEGSEPELLKSLRDLIDRHRPDLLIEVLSVTEAALNDLWFVRDGSYRLFNVSPDGLVSHERFEATTNRDYVLLPASK
jgi:FkbM family methyltransferase